MTEQNSYALAGFNCEDGVVLCPKSGGGGAFNPYERIYGSDEIADAGTLEEQRLVLCFGGQIDHSASGEYKAGKRRRCCQGPLRALTF